MANVEELGKEGENFLKMTHYTDLDDLAKINANTYMRGLQDGMRLAEKSGSGTAKQELVPV